MKRKYYRCMNCHIIFPVAASIASEYRSCPNCLECDTTKTTAKAYKSWMRER